MKSINVFLLALFSLSSINIMAQGEDLERREKMESLKIAHITNELSLSPEESEKFWPIYNKYDDARRQLKEEMRPSAKELRGEMSEKEAARNRMSTSSASASRAGKDRRGCCPPPTLRSSSSAIGQRKPVDG